MFGQDFGHRLRELRLAQGLTKEKFCEGDEVLSVRQLTRIETGKSQPKLETLEHLARRLNISLSELLGERAIGSKLPVEYLNLKYQLMHATSLDKPNNLMKLDEKLARLLGDTSLADIRENERCYERIEQDIRVLFFLNMQYIRFIRRTKEYNLFIEIFENDTV